MLKDQKNGYFSIQIVVINDIFWLATKSTKFSLMRLM